MRFWLFATVFGASTACMSAAYAEEGLCKMTAAQITAVAALPDPITQNAKGAFVRGGKIMPDDDVQDMCLTRNHYDLVAKRVAARQRLKISEVGFYEPAYLTAPECVRTSQESTLAVAGGVPVTPEKLAALENECKRLAGHP
jgi:hypothetical protein